MRARSCQTASPPGGAATAAACSGDTLLATTHGGARDEGGDDGGELLDGLAVAEDDLGHALAVRPAHVETGEIADRRQAEAGEAVDRLVDGRAPGRDVGEQSPQVVVCAVARAQPLRAASYDRQHTLSAAAHRTQRASA